RGGSESPPGPACAPRPRPRGTDSCRARSTAAVLLGGRSEAPFDFSLGEAGEFDDLVPRSVARNEGHRVARQRECLRDQPDDCLVRATSFWRSRDADLPGVAVAADDMSPP